jgi:AraC-like DNA-binding protein
VPERPGWVLASVAPVLHRLLEMHGLDVGALARATGFDLNAVRAPTERLDGTRVDALMRLALAQIGDPAFGLQAARCWHPSHLGVLGHAWLSCSTLRTGVQRLARYLRIVDDRARIETEEVRGGLKVRYWAGRGDPAANPLAAVTIDITMSILLDMCRLNAGAALRPLAASLRHGPPPEPLVYDRFFGCRVRFAARENTVVFARADVDRPLPTSNRLLAATFDRMLAEQLARLDRTDIVAGCQAAVLEGLSDGVPTQNEAAARLHVSPRTLQRKLAEAGVGFQQLLDQTRRDLALRYVEDPQRSLTDITFALGFAGPSSFTRAFRRWAGTSPSAYRAGRAAEQEAVVPLDRAA